MTPEQAAEYIREQTDKLDAPISYELALNIARHLYHHWGASMQLLDINVAQNCRRRYEGDSWENYND